MRRIAYQTIRFLRDPRKLFAAAGVSVAIGLVLGYVTVHEQAEKALALRHGPPPLVDIDDFAARQHVGPAREVTVRAHADLENPLVLPVPGDASGRTMIAVPLFPVRSDASSRTALGIMLYPVDPASGLPPRPEEHALVSGAAAHMTEVQINGQSVDAGDAGLMVAGALAVAGERLADDYLTVRPFLLGRDVALQPDPDPSTAWHGFVWLALVLVAAGFWEAARDTIGPLFAARRKEPERTRPRRGGAGAQERSTRFQPLPSQEEVNALRDEPPVREPSMTSRLVRFAAIEAARASRSLAGRVRNPR